MCIHIRVCTSVYLRSGKSDLVRLRCGALRWQYVAIAMRCDAKLRSCERFLWLAFSAGSAVLRPCRAVAWPGRAVSIPRAKPDEFQ